MHKSMELVLLIEEVKNELAGSVSAATTDELSLLQKEYEEYKVHGRHWSPLTRGIQCPRTSLPNAASRSAGPSQTRHSQLLRWCGCTEIRRRKAVRFLLNVTSCRCVMLQHDPVCRCQWILLAALRPGHTCC